MVIHAVAEFFVRGQVSRALQAVAPEFRQGQHPPSVPPQAHGAVVHMAAFQVAAALVVPAGGVVDGPGGVQGPQPVRDGQGIELAPALVEGHPQAQAHAVIQQVHRVLHVPQELPASGLSGPAQSG